MTHTPENNEQSNITAEQSTMTVAIKINHKQSTTTVKKEQSTSSVKKYKQPTMADIHDSLLIYSLAVSQKDHFSQKEHTTSPNTAQEEFISTTNAQEEYSSYNTNKSLVTIYQ